VHQLTTFQLTQHVARSLCNTRASCSYRIPHYRVTVSCEYYVHDEISMFTAVSSGSRRHGRPLTATAPLTQLVCVCTDLTRSANCSDRPLISCKNVLPAATYSRPVYKRCCRLPDDVTTWPRYSISTDHFSSPGMRSVRRLCVCVCVRTITLQQKDL